MAAADVESARAQDLPKSRKGLGQWMKGFSFGTLKGKSSGSKKGGNNIKHKKNHTHNGTFSKRGGAKESNHPYPESGHLQQRAASPASSANGQLSFATSRPPRESFASSPQRSLEEREGPGHGNKSGAPTLATNAETIHSDAGHSKAATTTTTHGGALSSIDGAGGGDSTFSSPNQSTHSLTTTLTTIQSTGANNALSAAGNATAHHHGSLNNPNTNVTFSHQYPVSPGPPSAIPRHLQDSLPTSSAGNSNLLSDNASILTLASSSKRRRRSMDTDASVRALAPSSVWGGSRESLPLSVLSGQRPDDDARSMHPTSHSRPSIGGLASAERASVYSSSGITAPALASERNSYYSKHKDLGDAKSLRSVTGIDARSTAGDNKSINADTKSLGGDVSSVRNNYEVSVRSGVAGANGGHSRNDSLPGSIGSPLASPRHMSTGTGGGGLMGSRRSSGFAEMDREMEGEDGMQTPDEEPEPKPPVADVINEVQKASAATAQPERQ